MAFFAKEYSPGGTYPQPVVSADIAGYTPSDTDQIIVSPGDEGVADANVNLWVVWDTNRWLIYASSAGYVGKIQVMIKTE